MTDKKIVMVRMKERELNGKTVGPDFIFKAHIEHAEAHNNDLLFTSTIWAAQDISHVILAFSDELQAIGEVVAKGKYEDNEPTNPEVYTIPSQWDQQSIDIEKPENYAWYELKNVKELDKETRDKLKYYKTDENLIEVFNNGDYHNIPLYFVVKEDK